MRAWSAVVLAGLLWSGRAEAQGATDTLYGTPVADPFRWLEQYDAPAVRMWYATEDSAARNILNATPHVARYYAHLQREVTNRQEFPSLITEQPGRTFYLKRRPGESSPALYLRDSYSGRERILVTATILEETRRASRPVITDYVASPSGSHAVVLFTAGGDERPNAMLVTDAGRLLPEELPPGANTVSWAPDGRTLFYRVARDAPRDATSDGKWGGLPIRRHRLGSSTASDVVVLDPVVVSGDSTWRAAVAVLSDGTVALALLTRSSTPRQSIVLATRADLLLRDGSDPEWVVLASPADSVTGVRIRGPWVYGISHRGTTIGRLVRLPLATERLRGVPSGKAAVLDWTRSDVLLDAPDAVFFNAQHPPVFARDGVYWLTAGQGHHRLFRYAFDTGAREEVALPFEGSADHLASLDPQPGVRFVFGGWTQGDRSYRSDPATREVIELPPFFNPPNRYDHLEGLEVRTVEVLSHDSARIPLTILRRAGPVRPRPTILAGYGAYGFTDDAYFRSDARPWLAAGGVYAICHVRGGGYHGEQWHQAGMRALKPNSWKDAIACGEYLVHSGQTTPAQLGLNGVSAGGIMAGRALTERPDLFAAVVIEAGLADMIRFTRTNSGPGNVHEFGSPDSEAGFRALLAMSPYHHVSPGTRYPAVLLYAPFNDARVAPWHAAKLAAALRAAGGTGARPVLLRVDFAAGHGQDSGMDGLVRRAAVVYGFFARRLGLVIPPASP